MQKTTTIRKANSKIKSFVNFGGEYRSLDYRQVKLSKSDHQYFHPHIENGVRSLKVGEFFTTPCLNNAFRRYIHGAGKRHNMELTVRNCPNNRANVMVMRLS